jgi:subtilisin family serine protease
MNEKEYMVVLQDGAEYDQIWNQIETPTVGLAYIPDRAVAIADNLAALPRITHYFLTDQEAEKLRSDPRVLGVEIPAEHRDDIIIKSFATQIGNVINGNFSKSFSPSGNIVNWGLIRHGYPNNDSFGLNSFTSSNYNYAIDGNNVDVLIIDSGIQADHPEFQYPGNSTSRVVPYLWDGTVNANTFYTDYNGHGTHVAGIATGKTFGWAKTANIYAIKYIDAPVTDPDQGFTGRTFSNVANMVVTWINNKPINSATGVKNPTVVNMSFGYSYSFSNVNSTIANAVWRGNTYSNPGWGNTTFGTPAAGELLPARVLGLDSPVDSILAAGATVCIAAGNDGLKNDISSGPDWNNFLGMNWLANSAPIGFFDYMRGSSPRGTPSTTGNACIVVGALASTPYTATTDTRATYSTTGPGVDVFAAGTRIMSAMSNNYDVPNVGPAVGNYFLNTSFKQAVFQGTSMAAPQVAGISALYLQINPTATPAQVKNWILNTATPNISANVANVSGSDYGNVNSQWGGNANVAFMPYNSANNFAVSNGITLSNISIVNS